MNTILERRLRAVVIAVFSMLCLSRALCAEKSVNYAIMYPKVRNEYASIFNDVIQGIQQTASQPSMIKIIDPSLIAQDVEQEFNDKQIDLVVALGSNAYQFAQKFTRSPPVLIGATRETVQYFSSLNMALAPDLMLDKLVRLAPKIKAVTIIYNPQENAWFVEQAQIAANVLNLKLNPVKVTSLKQAAQAYSAFFDRVDSEHEALWLPLDQTSVNEKITVPIVLAKAWEQRVLFFSCSPAHAQRGALFSVYPDNQLIGQDLGDLIRPEIVTGERKVHPMRRGVFILNNNTVQHLNLNPSDSLRAEFGLQLPR